MEPLILHTNFQSLLKLNPDEYARGFDDKENPKDISVLVSEIEAMAKKEKDLISVMPTVIQVSCFEINCKDTVQ